MGTHDNVDGSGAIVFAHRVEELFGGSSGGNERHHQEDGGEEDHPEQHADAHDQHGAQAATQPTACEAERDCRCGDDAPIWSQSSQFLGDVHLRLPPPLNPLRVQDNPVSRRTHKFSSCWRSARVLSVPMMSAPQHVATAATVVTQAHSVAQGTRARQPRHATQQFSSSANRDGTRQGRCGCSTQ